MKQTILTIIVACVMLTSCNNVKPLIEAPDIPKADIPIATDIPEEHYYENAHSPFEVEIKHNYFGGLEKLITFLALEAVFLIPISVVAYFTLPDNKPKEEGLQPQPAPRRRQVFYTDRDIGGR